MEIKIILHFDCEHWDSELDLCRLHTIWAADGTPIAYSCTTKCEDYKKKVEHCK